MDEQHARDLAIFETPTTTWARLSEQRSVLHDYRWRWAGSSTGRVITEAFYLVEALEEHYEHRALEGRWIIPSPPHCATAGTPQAILLDPLIPHLDRVDEVRKRVQVILAEADPPASLADRVKRRFWPVALGAGGTAIAGDVVYSAGSIPMTGSSLLLACLTSTGLWGWAIVKWRRPARTVISYDDALTIALARHEETRTAAQAAPAVTVAPPDVAAPSTSAMTAAARARLIASATSALTRLDEEWFAYEHHPDHLRDYYIDRPLLRDDTVPATAAYNDALYDLRERVIALTSASTDDDIRAADVAAEHALAAWSDAWDYAYEMKTTDRSAEERHALNRLFKIASQLRDDQTPREMWTGLIERMTRELNKIRTVPINHSALPDQLGIEAGRTLQLALTAAPATVSATESEARP